MADKGKERRIKEIFRISKELEFARAALSWMAEYAAKALISAWMEKNGILKLKAEVGMFPADSYRYKAG